MPPAVPDVALVGCGSWGKNILRDLVTIGCQVTVVAKSDASITRAREGGAVRIVESIDDLSDPDGVVVAVPTTVHVEAIERSLQFGVPVFVEKPLSSSVEDARRLAGRADVFVMDKWRYHPGIVTLREIIDEGRFGEMQGIQTVRHNLFNPHHDVDAVWVLAPHDLSIVLELTGGVPSPIAATGALVGIESNLVGILENDVVIDVSSRSNVFRREVKVSFHEAVVTLGNGYAGALDARLTRIGEEPEHLQIPISDEMPLLTELGVFVDHLQGGPPPKSTADEGVLIVERIQQLHDLAGI